LKQTLRLFENTYRLFWNDKVSVILTFIVPLILMALFGSIFGGSGTSPQGIRLALLNQSNSVVALRIESTLDTMKAFRIVRTEKNEAGQEIPFDTASIKEFVRSGNATAALVLPPDTFTDTSMGLNVKFYFDPKNAIETQMAHGLVEQALFSQVPALITQSGFRQASRALGAKPGEDFRRSMISLVGKYFKVDTTLLSNAGAALSRPARNDSSSKTSGFMEKMVHVDEEQLVGKELKNPWATRSVGGWAMTFLLFTLTAASSSLFDERRSGVMLRLLTSPVSRVHILWSKYLFNMTLGVIQLLFMFSAGWILFDVDIFSNFFNLILIVVAASVACTAFGMLLASVSQTRQQANGLGTLLILSMSAVGGAWFPTSFMPSTIQFFSKLTVVYWSMDGFLQVLWRGAGTSAIIPNIIILLGIGAVVNAFSVWRFRTGHIFD